MNDFILSVEKLSKSYGKIDAVKSISFNVKNGEIFALIGPNGAGKSTTLKVITTLLTPTTGKVIVGGFDIIKNPQEIRKMISYLPEEAGAYKNLKGIEYLDFMANIIEADKVKRTDFLKRAKYIANLGSRLNDKIGT
ncbi:MAG: ATP-binding cassette domain-containing protein, partial [Bacteroidales bacterium]|nr:ATP-binding cassette domain-containing protein [Bacteroidales bacterium]